MWPESASELYRPSDCCLSAKLVPTFADRGCHVVSVADPYGRILRFLDRNKDTMYSQILFLGLPSTYDPSMLQLCQCHQLGGGKKLCQLTLLPNLVHHLLFFFSVNVFVHQGNHKCRER
jgi:hypothetical protein